MAAPETHTLESQVPQAGAPDARAPLSWEQLAALAPAEPERVHGPTSSQALLRLFGATEAEVRVTLYRDNHAWCPYCQKVWLWLEEKRIPYRVRKVSMRCYGEKERWYSERVPSGLLPALELDGRLLTESDAILQALETSFGPLAEALESAGVKEVRRLERRFFRAWCHWLCTPHASGADETLATEQFERMARAVSEALQATPGPFFRPQFSAADVIFTPFLERASASLYAYKGYDLREDHPAINLWFTAMEQRPTYLGTQSDFLTHVHDLPPQMGGCHPSNDASQRAAWQQVALGFAPNETSQAEPAEAALEALARVIKHRRAIVAVNPWGGAGFDQALRCALSNLLAPAEPCVPPEGSAAGLRHLRTRLSVPRDMGLHAARRLRRVLEITAALDGHQQADPIPTRHRLDQDLRPFQSMDS
ncbi:glutathione S-transferase family protein [Cyanobium sp. Morenito 9A2]|uniref:glutathione S-transferase family protein n=1 Tax=Cyanobium sp. Morenito 9A2 TaxID=2823718 RepID=UPI0020CBC5A7|nr:glutathione S-transferase family protein [Cyanobium sp. Morenito 9A2]MCP9848580.1 glutathione S-transferase family protein [Cyanobium sp. Morenito 9A2]